MCEINLSKDPRFAKLLRQKQNTVQEKEIALESPITTYNNARPKDALSVINHAKSLMRN